MNGRVLWFLIGAAIASAFWLAVINGIGRQWYDQLIKLG